MPLYSYKCSQCDAPPTELLRPVADRDKPTFCQTKTHPTVIAKPMRRVPDVPARPKNITF